MIHHLTSAVSDSVDIGKIGAIATEGEDTYDGYYLVEFAGCPYTEQETDGSLKCKGNLVVSSSRSKEMVYKVYYRNYY